MGYPHDGWVDKWRLLRTPVWPFRVNMGTFDAMGNNKAAARKHTRLALYLEYSLLTY
jgi:hypothetical protein